MEKNKRFFPWRETNDPYEILMAEILLHRTKASQVLPIYNEFIKKFPDFISITQASLNKIREILYPLGLHWRTDNLYGNTI